MVEQSKIQSVLFYLVVVLGVVIIANSASAHRMNAQESISQALQVGLVAPRQQIKQGMKQKLSQALHVGNDLLTGPGQPVVKKVAMWLAGTRVGRAADDMLISNRQIAKTRGLLQPGDILLETASGYLADNFIKGFWGHTMIYTGSFDEAAQAFDTQEVRAHFAELGYKGFADYVERSMPRAAATWQSLDKVRGEARRVIESDGMNGGVVMSSYSDACHSDNCAGLRPRKLSQLDKALAVIDALSYLGADYDFSFDMRNDKAVVCSELVAKAYASGEHKHGVDFKVTQLSSGQTMVYPNAVAEHFASQQQRTDRDLDFLFFIRGDLQHHRAELVDADTLASSVEW